MDVHCAIVSERSHLIRGLCALVVAGVTWAHAQKAVTPMTPQNQQVTGFRVPSYDARNNLTSQMFGDTATILTDGRVDITELRMEFYSGTASNRQTEMRVTSPRCVYNRNTGSATSAAPVRIARDNMVVTGQGFEWSNKDQRLVILGDAKVVLKEAQRIIEEGIQP